MSKRRDERGAVAIIVAVSLTALLVIVAMVLDFGLIRVDRQVDKSAADSAALAGLHALNVGDANTRPFVGVCTAINYLQKNSARFSSLTPGAGSWLKGDATSWGVANPCNDPIYQQKTCDSSIVPPTPNPSFVKFSWTGTVDGEPLNVVIESGYVLGTFSEDSIPAAQADNDDGANGCDQLAVTINQQRSPGLGSLATGSGHLKTSIRSVGRVKQDTGGYAPAMLLLRRTGCPGIDLTAAGGGAGSYVHVEGRVSTNNLSQPGTIHIDSDGTGCSSGNQIYQGKANDGVVAYAAPTVGAPTTPDATKPGQLSYVAGGSALADNIIRDGALQDYGSKKLDALTTSAATDGVAPVARPLVTRKPVDSRYKSGVTNIITAANTNVFNKVVASAATTTANFSLANYAIATCSGSGGSTVTAPAFDAAKTGLYVPCSGVRSANITGWKTIVFHDTITPQGGGNDVLLPDASKVYVVGASSGAGMDVRNTFAMNTTGNVTAGKCTQGTRSLAQRAIMVVKGGSLDTSTSGAVLRLCNTTVVLMGGSTTGCVPTYSGTAPAPTTTPCGGAAGTGVLNIGGGTTDWTAPDALDVTTDSAGQPTAGALAAWGDVNGPEDLALWAESYSNGTGLQGSSSPLVRGVFMTPNVLSFSIGGNAAFNLVNAQFIATSLHLNGGVQVTLSVDPNSAVTLPKLTLVGLVR